MIRFFKREPKNKPPRRQASASPPDEPNQLTFRRGRTLTGSLLSHVKAVNEGGADLKSHRVQAHELKRQRRHVGLLLLAVLGVSLSLIFLLSEFTASVKARIEQVSPSNGDGYISIIDSYLAARPLERLRFMQNDEQLTAYVRSKAPEVLAVKDDGWAGFGSSQFSVSVRKPVAAWSIGGSQQYVDSEGVAFAKNYFSVPKVRVIDETGAALASTSQVVASNRFLGLVGRVSGLFAAQSLVVTDVTIPSGTTRLLEVKLEGIAYPIRMTIDRSAGEQVEDTTRTIQWMRERHLTPQYIDVRVAGKAVYK